MQSKTILIFFLILVAFIGAKANQPVYKNGTTSYSTFEISVQNLKWYHKEVFYQLDTKNFYDSDENGVGDFNGIIQKLDYLEKLGITAVWLMPMMKQEDNVHGYEVIDFYEVASQFGGEQDFRDLLQALHEHNMKVLIDFVPNHASYLNQWFQDSRNEINGKNDWFVWSENKKNNKFWLDTIRNQYFYSEFWYTMPEFNYRSSEVKAEMIKVGKFWLENYGIDGYRVDVPYQLVENKEANNCCFQEETYLYWKEWTKEFFKSFPNAFLVAENWEEPELGSRIVNTGGFSSAFNKWLRDGLLSSLNSGSGKEITDRLHKSLKTYPNYSFSPISGNHDMPRLMNSLDNNIFKVKVAMAYTLTIPGIPFIYQGDELGMEGNTHDRIRFNWSAVEEQSLDESSLLNFVQKVAAIRKGEKALQIGNYKDLISNNASVISYMRKYEDEVIITIINLSDKTCCNVDFSLSHSGIAQGVYFLENLFNKNETNAIKIDDSGKLMNWSPFTELKPYSVYVFKLNK